MGPVRTIHVENGDNSYTSDVFKDFYKVLNVHISYTSSASAGTRTVAFELIHSDGHTIWDSKSGATQAASLLRHYSIAPGFPRETSFSGNDDLYMPIPDNLIIIPGSIIKVYDTSDRSVTDTFHLSVQYEEI